MMTDYKCKICSGRVHVGWRWLDKHAMGRRERGLPGKPWPKRHMLPKKARQAFIELRGNLNKRPRRNLDDNLPCL